MKPFLAALSIAGFTLPAQAVTVVQWDFEAATFPAPTTTWTGIAASTGNGTASSVHAATATWSTPAGNGSPKAASGNTWAVGDYWEFSFSTLGYAGLMVNFDQTGSGTGPRDFTFAYSSDGVSFTNLASYSLPAITWTGTTYKSGSTFTMDLSAVSALNNNSTVVLRLIDASTTSIAGNTVAAGGTDRVDNFTVNLTPVPEAGTAAMLFAGLAVLGFTARRQRNA